MAALSIRGLDDAIRERLRLRAARHGRSMEAEILAILTDAVQEPGPAEGLLTTLLDRVGELGGVELELGPRTGSARAVDGTGIALLDPWDATRPPPRRRS